MFAQVAAVILLEMPNRPGSMLEALAWACRAQRRAHKIPRWQIARRGNMDPATIVRFEQAKAWPRDIEAIVAVYALCTDTERYELWEAALHAWSP